MKSSLVNGILIGIAFGSLISACNPDKTAKTTPTETNRETPVLPVFKDRKTGDVFRQYIELKNAMVASDFTASKEKAKKLMEISDAVPSVATIAKKIEQAKDLSGQRIQLESLTTEVEKQVKSSKLHSGVIYKQYCPMANDGNGGYWLATEATIRNPYYGDEMLQCGEVKEEIK